MNETIKAMHNAAHNAGWLITTLVRHMLPPQPSVGAITATGAFLSILGWTLLTETYAGHSFFTTLLPCVGLAVTFFYILLGFIEVAVVELAPLLAHVEIVEEKEVHSAETT